MTNQNNISDSKIGKLLGVLCVIVFALAGIWFFAYHVYVAPTAEAITITLPPGVVASDAVLVGDGDSGGNYGRE